MCHLCCSSPRRAPVGVEEVALQNGRFGPIKLQLEHLYTGSHMYPGNVVVAQAENTIYILWLFLDSHSPGPLTRSREPQSAIFTKIQMHFRGCDMDVHSINICVLR